MEDGMWLVGISKECLLTVLLLPPATPTFAPVSIDQVSSDSFEIHISYLYPTEDLTLLTNNDAFKNLLFDPDTI
jgi:hypothetical protein